MGFNPFKAAENKAKEVIKKIVEPAARKIERELWSIKDKAKEIVRKVGNEVEDKIHDVGNEIEDKLKEAGQEIEDGLTETIPDLLEDAMEALAQAVAKEGLKTVQSVVKTTHAELNKLEKNKPELVGAINQLGGRVEIGPLTLAYANFYTRTELVSGVLDEYINHPPEFRRGPIIDMVRALGPDSVDLGISVQVMAVVVGSKELGVGGGLNDVSIDLFAEIGDVVLEKMGVPA